MNAPTRALTSVLCLSLALLAGYGIQEAEDEAKKEKEDAQEKRLKLLEQNLTKLYEELKRNHLEAAELGRTMIERMDTEVENTTNLIVETDAVEEAVKKTHSSMRRRLQDLSQRMEDVVVAIGNPEDRLGTVVMDQGFNYVLLRNGAIARVTNGKITGFR